MTDEPCPGCGCEPEIVRRFPGGYLCSCSVIVVSGSIQGVSHD